MTTELTALGLTPAEIAHVEQWVRRAVQYAAASDDPEAALRKGMDDYQTFLLEMSYPATPRARMARHALTAQVWHQCQEQAASAHVLACCEQIDAGA